MILEWIGKRRVFSLLVLAAMASLFAVENAMAHQVSSVSLIARLNTEKRTYFLDAAMEVVPSVDQVLNDQISPEDAAREFAQEYLDILFDQKEVEPELEISIETSSDENTPEELQRQQVIVEMSGAFPEGAKEFLLYLDPSCPMAVVMVTIKDDRPSRRMQVVLAGEYSRPVNIQPLVEGDPFTESGDEEKNESAGEAKAGVEKEKSESSPKKKSSIIAGWLAFFGLSLVPALLPIAILLLTLNRRPAFGQIAALVVGQGPGVALAAFGMIGAFVWAIPIAGLLLVLLAGEAIFHRECKWWRFALALAAGFFSGWLISQAPAFTAFFGGEATVSTISLLGFVLGTELGLVVAALVGAGVLLFLSRFDWYRNAIVQPIAILCCGYGIFLMIERFL